MGTSLNRKGTSSGFASRSRAVASSIRVACCYHSPQPTCTSLLAIRIHSSFMNGVRPWKRPKTTYLRGRNSDLQSTVPFHGWLHRSIRTVENDLCLLQTPRSQNSHGKQTMMEDAGSLRRPTTSTSTPGSWSQFLHGITSPSRDCRKRTNPVDTPQCASGRHDGFHDHGYPQSLRSMPCKCPRRQQSSTRSPGHSSENFRDLSRGSSLPNMPEEGMSSVQLLELSARFARLADAQRQRERQVLSRRPKVRASDWARPYHHRSSRVDGSSCADDELLDYLADGASSLEDRDDLLIQLMNCRRHRSQ
jgi:hypothetical protein